MIGKTNAVGIFPKGKITITANATDINVKNYALADVNVSGGDSGEYVRPVGAPNTDTIALNAPIINQGGINYYPIFAASAMDTFVSTTFTKTGAGVSTGADAYV